MFVSTGTLLNPGERGFIFKQTTTSFQHADLTIPPRPATVKRCLSLLS